MTAIDSSNKRATGNAGFGVRLTASGVAVSRGGARIIHDVTFEMGRGDAIILRGPNGAGKTTLLRSLAGLLRRDAGTVTIASATGAAIDDASKAVVYCGPANSVKGALTVDENLAFWAALYQATAKDVGAARAAFNLDAYAGRRASALSTGLARRLGLSRLILANRPLWLVDEPTISLDTASIAIFEKLVAAHCANGGGAIVATHDALSVPGARGLMLGVEAVP